MKNVLIVVLALMFVSVNLTAQAPPATKSLLGTVTALKPETKEIEVKADNAAPTPVKLLPTHYCSANSSRRDQPEKCGAYQSVRCIRRRSRIGDFDRKYVGRRAPYRDVRLGHRQEGSSGPARLGPARDQRESWQPRTATRSYSR